MKTFGDTNMHGATIKKYSDKFGMVSSLFLMKYFLLRLLQVYLSQQSRLQIRISVFLMRYKTCKYEI
jgi:hypothetical protein